MSKSTAIVSNFRPYEIVTSIYGGAQAAEIVVETPESDGGLFLGF